MFECKHASRLASQSVDRKLTLRENLSLRLHLLVCKSCAHFSEQIKLMRQAIRQLSTKLENDDSITLPVQARDRIQQKISTLN